MTRFTIFLRCLKCGHKYKRVVQASDRSAVDDVPDPPCPKCKKHKKKTHSGLKGIIQEQKAPAFTGNSLIVKAIDETASIVMQDYGVTDLQTNTRQGDQMAPKLTPRQAKMSENFWGGKRNNKPLMDPAQGQQMVSQAMQGAFLPGRGALAGDGAVSGNELLSSLHKAKAKPKTTIIASMDRNTK